MFDFLHIIAKIAGTARTDFLQICAVSRKYRFLESKIRPESKKMQSVSQKIYFLLILAFKLHLFLLNFVCTLSVTIDKMYTAIYFWQGEKMLPIEPKCLKGRVINGVIGFVSLSLFFLILVYLVPK